MGEKPVFDLSELSWKDSKALTAAQMRVKGAAEAGDWERLEQGFAEMQQFLARVVVSIPREWLVKSAPADVDWSDPASFDLLRAKRMNDVLKLLNEAQEPDAVSKN